MILKKSLIQKKKKLNSNMKKRTIKNLTYVKKSKKFLKNLSNNPSSYSTKKRLVLNPSPPYLFWAKVALVKSISLRWKKQAKNMLWKSSKNKESWPKMS